MKTAGQLFFQEKKQLIDKKQTRSKNPTNHKNSPTPRHNTKQSYHQTKTPLTAIQTNQNSSSDKKSRQTVSKLVEEAQTEALKEAVKEEQKNQIEFEKFEKPATDILLSIEAVFPFDFFPDTLVIDKNKVSVVHKTFLWTENIQTVLINHISDVEIQKAPFFAQLTIHDQFFEQTTMRIRFLKIKDAEKAHNLIRGLLVLKNEKIDTTNLTTQQLLAKLASITPTGKAVAS